MDLGPLRRGSLLIVEDERVLSACLRRHFSALGMDVTVAGSVAEGRGFLDRSTYDACLLDMGLPDGDGLSLIGATSGERSIVITATPDYERLAAAGVRHVLAKPIDLDVITRMVDELPLDRVRSSEEDAAPTSPSALAASGRRPETVSPIAVAGDALEEGAEPAPGGRVVPARPLRIMLYSHDTVGLGHFRRNLTIARALSALHPRPNVLMVSGATEAVRFPKPQGVDLITLPALAKVDRSKYASRSLGVAIEDLIALRSQIICAAAASFAPDVLLVDNVPRGAERELDATLAHLRTNTLARIVLGLRDVLDEPAAVARDWSRLENEAAIERFYDAIWVYGDPSVVEVGIEYDFSREIREKLHYVGYLDRRPPVDGGAPRASDRFGRDASTSLPEVPYVLCLVGGGEDGDRIADAFSLVEPARCGGLMRVLLLGPFMPEAPRAELHRRAAADPGLRILDFSEDPARLIANAVAVVSMGGHNSISEILSYDKPALIVPRIVPRREQWIRAQRLAGLGIVDVCEPDDLSPDLLGDWIEKGARRPRSADVRVDMGGIERVRALLHGIVGRSVAEPCGSRR